MRTFGKWLGRLLLLVLLGLGAFLWFGPGIADKKMNPVDYSGPYAVTDAAQTLHDGMIVGDWHADTMLWTRDINQRYDRGHVDLPRLIEGGVGLQVAWDVLEITDMPLIVSHTGLHSFCPVKRNFPDDLMIAIAQTGGTIGMGYWGEVACGKIEPEGIAAMIKAAIDVLGEDHVSLGSDYDGTVKTAFDTSDLAALTSALLEAAVSEAQIRKVMGDNMVRVLRARLN